MFVDPCVLIQTQACDLRWPKEGQAVTPRDSMRTLVWSRGVVLHLPWLLPHPKSGSRNNRPVHLGHTGSKYSAFSVGYVKQWRSLKQAEEWKAHLSHVLTFRFWFLKTERGNGLSSTFYSLSLHKQQSISSITVFIHSLKTWLRQYGLCSLHCRPAGHAEG